MKIEKVRVENYRNLSDVTVQLDPEANYLIGENNIGKSNFVDLLCRLLGGGSIEDDDYQDFRKPIRVELTLTARPGEPHRFGAPAEDGTVRIICTKDIADVKVNCVREETGQAIQHASLRYINFFRDDVTTVMDSQDEPHPRIGAFLLHLIRRQIRIGEKTKEGDSLLPLLGNLNEQLGRIKAFSDFGLHAEIEPDAAGMLSRLIYLLDESSLPLERSGNGVQYTAMAMMNIINRILTLFNSNSTPLSKMVRRTEDGKRILPMVLALDEPEVHLHPYMQRSLIRYYKRIMNNQDEPFLDLLKTSFDLDGLDGQLLIITHSAEALVDNFRNLIRFYKDSHGRTRTACGPMMHMGPDIEKHLIMQFPDIKEAFYARCALIVEGTTEASALRQFAETLGVPMDDYGICVIDAGGEGNLKKLRSLLGRFGVNCVLMFDGDVRPDDSNIAPNEFFTRTPCFETEIAGTLIDRGEYDLLNNIITQLDPRAMPRGINHADLEKPLQKFGKPGMRVPRSLSALKRDGSEVTRVIYAAWLYKNKGAMLGRILGNSLPAGAVPESYREAILRAKNLAIGSRQGKRRPTP